MITQLAEKLAKYDICVKHNIKPADLYSEITGSLFSIYIKDYEALFNFYRRKLEQEWQD